MWTAAQGHASEDGAVTVEWLTLCVREIVQNNSHVILNHVRIYATTLKRPAFIISKDKRLKANEIFHLPCNILNAGLLLVTKYDKSVIDQHCSQKQVLSKLS